MNKLALVLGVIAIAIAALLFLTQSQEGEQIHHHAEAEKVWTADEVKAWYRKKSPNLSDEALSHITDDMVEQFVANSQETRPDQVVDAPKSKEVVIEGFVVSSPDISEAEMDDAAKRYKLEYALCSLNTSTLNLLRAEYRDDYRAVFKDMGVEQRCENGLCGYAVKPGTLAVLMKGNGIQTGDQLLSINGVQLSDMDGFQGFHDTVLSRGQRLQLQVQRDGQVVELADYSCQQNS